MNMIVDQETPFWWEEQRFWVMHETENWIVCVTPMMFNDRINLASKTELGRTWTAGFCYQDRPMAKVAALTWNPETEQYPRHFFKIAFDGRHESYSGGSVALCQYLCLYCSRQMRGVKAVMGNSWDYLPGADACSVCGVTGRPSEWFMPDAHDNVVFERRDAEDPAASLERYWRERINYPLYLPPITTIKDSR